MNLTDSLPPLRVMLLGSDPALLAALTQLLQQTRMWQPTDGEATHGALQLQTVLLSAVNCSEPQVAAAVPPAEVQLLPLTVNPQQYQLQAALSDFTAVLACARQQDWLLFVDHATTGSLQALWLLLLAEALHARLPWQGKPQLILSQAEPSAGSWADFYQQLDLQSRWFSLIDRRWLLANQAGSQLTPTQVQAELLYLMLLASLPAEIGPTLPNSREHRSGAGAGGEWQDWHVLPAVVTPAATGSTCCGVMPPAVATLTADVSVTQLSVQQGSLLDTRPQPNCRPVAHHQFTQVAVCLQQLPPHLAHRQLLLLQQQRARPNWQLQGYWRLQLS